MLEISHLSFSYPQPENTRKIVLHDFSMTIADGEIVAVMGASGTGKTTLLRLLAGLERPDGGEIKRIRGCNRPSIVFQEPRLFPWLTVRQNLLAVLSSDQTGQERIPELLSDFGLAGCENLYPNHLSGGMRSRIALARALLYGGDLFLLDEPFAALDRDRKQEVLRMTRSHIRKCGASAILVTHDVAEATAFANRIVLLEE